MKILEIKGKDKNILNNGIWKKIEKAFYDFWKIRANLEWKKIKNENKYIKDIKNIVNNIENNFILIQEEENEKILWFLIFSKKKWEIPYFQDEKYVYINYIYVSSILQWKWYSSKMFSLVKNFAKKENIEKIKLNVSINNEKAISIYEKWWFNIDYYSMSK